MEKLFLKAKIYSLLTEAEAIKIKVLSYGTIEDTDTRYFEEAEEQMLEISKELKKLSEKGE